MRLCEGDLPTICSVCRQPPSTYLEGQVPEYVNMESAYDGPVVRISDNIPPVYVENIVICEGCVKAAAGLLGMEPGPQRHRRQRGRGLVGIFARRRERTHRRCTA